MRQTNMADLQMDHIPDLTPSGYTARYAHGRVTSLHYPDGTVRIQHQCTRRTEDGMTLIVAPALTVFGHTVVSIDPVTITPSILCEDCGMHGYITDGVWLDA